MATSEKTNNNFGKFTKNALNSHYNELLKRVDPLRVEYNYRKLLHDARKNGVWCNDYHLSALSSVLKNKTKYIYVVGGVLNEISNS
ncbi:hypothetical protein BpHYR1_050482 [Brachionus plicatilis]|uniref:Uncharacterized protein n=1 Tax=Brachionus plicatilis TaxID=10195 RepID=A0A3M7QBC5_BRAPC|nr:hypothetical protein BpHYR1_050482 [Brachionus plicatilis]